MKPYSVPAPLSGWIAEWLPPSRCPLRLVRAGGGMVLLRRRVAHHICGKPGICSGGIHRLLPTSPGIAFVGTMIFYPLRLAGYSLLSIGVINFFSRYVFDLELVKSVTGRLSIVNSLIAFAPWLLLSLALIFLEGNRSRRSREHLPVQLLHRLLLPLLVGYLLLVPLMIRDTIGYNSSVKSEISSQLQIYRNGSRQLLDQVAPLSTPLAVARVVQRYPNIAMTVVPTETASQVKAKLAQALSNSEASLMTRLDDQRRTRLEGLFQRTITSIFVALVAAAGLAGLRRQNLAVIRASGHKVGEYFAQDLLIDRSSQGGLRGSLDPQSPSESPSRKKSLVRW
jgi:hypothetical protein